MDETTQAFEAKAELLGRLLRELEAEYLAALVTLANPPRIPPRAGEGE
jgi:hypothetical protein